MKQLKVIGVLLVCLLAAITTGLTAEPLQQQEKVTPLVGTDAPPTEEAQGELIWFTDQAEFETFVASQGAVLKGIEDFEESILGPNDVEALNDPLESGVPNLPDAFPFPAGLTGLPNLRVQSNLGGGNPTVPNPRGPNGLCALSVGADGAASDMVVALFAVDSLDLIFTEVKSGVGFNTIRLGAPGPVEVRVYSTTNVFLGMMESPANAAGTNFIGVWSIDPIGRINIFAAGGGLQGGDNIQAWEVGAPPCSADFDNSGDVGVKDLLFLLGNWGPCPK